MLHSPAVKQILFHLMNRSVGNREKLLVNHINNGLSNIKISELLRFHTSLTYNSIEYYLVLECKNKYPSMYDQNYPLNYFRTHINKCEFTYFF